MISTFPGTASRKIFVPPSFESASVKRQPIYIQTGVPFLVLKTQKQRNDSFTNLVELITLRTRTSASYFAFGSRRLHSPMICLITSPSASSSPVSALSSLCRNTECDMPSSAIVMFQQPAMNHKQVLRSLLSKALRDETSPGMM